MTDSPNELNGTQSESGQVPDTQAEVSIEAKNEGFDHFVRQAPGVIPPMVAWAPPKEDHLSFPEGLTIPLRSPINKLE